MLPCITVVHSQTSACTTLMGKLTLTAALCLTRAENVAFRLKSLPTHDIGNMYSDKGELKNALEYYDESLKIKV